jgi:hypothetical protein
LPAWSIWDEILLVHREHIAPHLKPAEIEHFLRAELKTSSNDSYGINLTFKSFPFTSGRIAHGADLILGKHLFGLFHRAHETNTIFQANGSERDALKA